MKFVFSFLMIGMTFTVLQTATAQEGGMPPMGDHSGMAPMGDHSGMAPMGDHSGMAPMGDHSGMAPMGDHTGMATPGHHSGGDVDISHCADMPATTRPACEAQAHSGSGGHHDGPPIDPRTITDANPTGIPFTKADEDKYQVYADECASNAGAISAESLATLTTQEGFTEEMVNGLCQMSANDGPKDCSDFTLGSPAYVSCAAGN